MLSKNHFWVVSWSCVSSLALLGCNLDIQNLIGLISFFLNFITNNGNFSMKQLKLTGALVGHSVLFILLCLACTYQSWKCIALYNLRETSVKMILMDGTDERFPSIALNPGFRQEVFGKINVTHLISRHNYKLSQPNSD